MSTRSPGSRPETSYDSTAETNAVGIVASSVTGTPGGASATISSQVTVSDPKVPNASPTTRSPTATVDTSDPTSRTRPQNSPPTSPSSMRPMERNTSQKLRPAASTATRTSPGPGERVKGSARRRSREPPASGSTSQGNPSGGVSRAVPSPVRTSRAAWRRPNRYAI